tara:strand:+ start:1707 stop:2138 length:432 start_codon:yes stop_codon:yes gene_type:complete
MIITQAERSTLLDLDEDELFANLARNDPNTMAALGAAGQAHQGFLTRAELQGEVQAAGFGWNELVSSGKALFRALWDAARNIVCGAYGELTSNGGIGEVLDQVAKAIVAALNWSAFVAYLVVRAAVKGGLDNLCGLSNMPVRD